VFDRQEMVDRADKAGIAVWGVGPEEIAGWKEAE